MNRLKLRRDNCYRLCLVRGRDGSIRLEEKIAPQLEPVADWPTAELERPRVVIVVPRPCGPAPQSGKTRLAGWKLAGGSV